MPLTFKRSDEIRSLPSLVVPLVRPERRRLIWIATASIVGGFAEAAVLVLIARIAFALTSDDSTVAIQVGPLPKVHLSIGTLIAAALGLIVVRVVLQAVQTVLSSRSVFSVANRTRKDLIRLYMNASWPLLARQREGRLQELLTTYANCTGTIVRGLTTIAVSGFSVGAMLITAVVVSPIAAVGAALAALALGLLLRPLRGAVRRRSARAAEANLEFATSLTESTAILQAVRIFQAEEPVTRRLTTLSDDAVKRTLKTAYVSNSVPVIYQGAAMLLIVGGLGITYASGVSGLASLGAVVLIMLRSLGYAQSLQTGIQQLHENAPYVEALAAEEDLYRSAALPAAGEPIDGIDDISFDRVSYAYGDGEPVLHEVSFAAHRGDTIGIVGPSGSGKSTLAQLILRLREPTDGVIRCGGRDTSCLSISDWYRHIAFVPQDALLFSGSVADNIRFFRDDVDDAAVERAAKSAHIHHEIVSWPNGYDTPVGERGHQLSGGQRQRICIARALAEEPDVIVFDEPTSALDIESEASIRDTIELLGAGVTVFIIAHRLSTLAICDRIMVVLNGALEGFDEPSVLEQTNPFYREALRLSSLH